MSEDVQEILTEELQDLFNDAVKEAISAMEKYPQPAKISPIPKLAEESGETIQAAHKFIEGKGSLNDVYSEMVQVIAVLIRWYLEGDQSMGLPPVVDCDQ